MGGKRALHCVLGSFLTGSCNGKPQETEQARGAPGLSGKQKRRSLMTRLVVTTVLLLLCSSFPTSLMARDKAPSVDMSKMTHIFLGWVDVDPSNFAQLGYSKAEWIEVISSANQTFQKNCQSKYLTGRSITLAKDKGDENAAGNDLYIKFSDVRIDYENYHLILSMHFIDPKTNSEIASIPARPYYGNDWGFRNYLKAALDEVCTKVQVEVTGEQQGKKK
jgi:hypothetical protein